MRAAQKLLGVPTIGGGSAQAGGGGGGSQRSQICHMPLKIYKNGNNRGGFAHFLAYKLPKTLFSAQKYLTRYTPETFLRNTLILKIFVT